MSSPASVAEVDAEWHKAEALQQFIDTTTVVADEWATYGRITFQIHPEALDAFSDRELKVICNRQRPPFGGEVNRHHRPPNVVIYTR